jgi:D-alanine-D-alanine ligase
MSPRRSLNVAVLCGGPSAEREVSLESGREVAAALSRRGHRVSLLDPRAERSAPDAFLRLAAWRRFDVAFLALHGTFGEDGTVQRLLDRVGLPYTGSGPEASRLAFTKSAAKGRFAAAGVATPPAVRVRQVDPPCEILLRAATVGYPLVAKPDAQGSSLGVGIVASEGELPAALDRCFALGPSALLERYVAGTEWTVGFLGGESLPPMCVSTPRAFLDFDAKYRDEATTVDFETDTPPAVVARIVAQASEACRSLGVTGVSRVDLRLDGRSQPWVLEVNTLPGFTPHSAVPTAAARAGIDFESLCERVISLAFKDRTVRRAA